jgi:hypothetical protein
VSAVLSQFIILLRRSELTTSRIRGIFVHAIDRYNRKETLLKKKQMDRFTYFDFIAHIVPGAILLGAISFLVKSNTFILITGNAAIDLLLFIIISFAIGAFVHQLSNVLVQPLIKWLFWHGRFYSEVYLVKQYKLCQDPLRTQIISKAKELFHFDEISLASLDIDFASNNSIDPYVVSHQIYRRFDYFTLDKDLARKGHTANVLYSLFRTMTLATFILATLFCVSFLWNALAMGTIPRVILAIISLLASLLFLFRARREGERYVQGVLSAV